jgi:hypothetical protein
VLVAYRAFPAVVSVFLMSLHLSRTYRSHIRRRDGAYADEHIYQQHLCGLCVFPPQTGECFAVGEPILTAEC